MTLKKPRATTLEEFIKTATMFYIDGELEKKFTEDVNYNVEVLQTKLLGIATIEGLKSYIHEDNESIDRVISLLNISEEKFKRIITMIRIQKRFVPTGDWSLQKIREQMIAEPSFMDEVCELFLRGAAMEKYKKLIPEYYLANFQIDASTFGRLAIPDDIKRLVKKGLEGKYNNKIGDSFFSLASGCITAVCDKSGLTYSTKKRIPLVNKVISVAIPNESTPRLLIDITYGITTSSTQTKYAERAQSVASKLRDLNLGKPDKERILFINVVDGAGWVARQSDLRKIERCSDYLLNLQKIGTIEEIINYYI